MHESERGSVLPLMVLVMMIAVGSTVVLTRLGEAAVGRARARTAADAAALAGAAEGEASAQAIATENGGQIRSFRARDGDVEVRVTVGPASAVARARRNVVGGDAMEGSPGG